MINLYELLGIDNYSGILEVRMALQTAKTEGQINPAVLDKAQQWLLDPEVKTRYDAQLKAYLHQNGDAVAVPNDETDLTLQTQTVHSLSGESKIHQHSSNIGHEASEEMLFEALIGPKNTDYYLEEFAKLQQGQRPRLNLAALGGGAYWLCARGMWKEGLGLMLLPPLFLIMGGGLIAMMAPKSAVFPIYMLVMGLIWFVARWLYLPLKANRLYCEFAQKRIIKLKAQYHQQPKRLFKVLQSTTNILAGWVMFAVFGVWTLLATLGIVAAILFPFLNKMG